MKSSLKKLLDSNYAYFDREHISPDPLEFLHRFSDPYDIEITGFLASVFSYGNVNQILNTVNKILGSLNNQPYLAIKNIDNYLSSNNIRHRFYTTEDVRLLLRLLNRIILEYGTLKKLFLENYRPEDANLKYSISSFSRIMLTTATDLNGGELSKGFRFMFSDPYDGSACKRFNLFLRWMVRKDRLDFGLWNEIPPAKLVIPVDVHVAKVSAQLGLTKRKNISWKMAEEITENLRTFDPLDPVKYDFAICHIGMRKLQIKTNDKDA